MLFDGLSPIVCGVLGYVSIILYDLNNTSHNNDLSLIHISEPRDS